MEITLKNHISGKKYQIQVESTETVVSLKKRFEEIENLRPSLQLLFYQKNKMIDEKTIIDYNIQSGSIIDIYLNRIGG